jgi:hypothetical protein
MKTHSKNTLTESEYFLFFSLIIGFALFCHLLALFLSSNGTISEPEEFYIYSLVFSIGPIITYLFYRFIATQLTAIRQVFFFVNGYLILLFIIALLIFILEGKKINPNFVYLYSFLQIFLSLSIFVFVKLITRWNNRIINLGNQWFVVVFPLILVFFLLSDYQMGIINAAFKSSSFQFGLVLGLFLCALVLIFQKFSQHPNFLIKNTLNIPSKIFLVLTLIHIPLFFLQFAYLTPQLNLTALDHHIPYTGPAYAILGGRIPLVDTFSQYGMFAFLPYTLAFFFLAPSILTASLVTALLNILQNLVFFLILNKTVANKFLVYFGTLLTLILYYAIAPMNQISIPSTYGARFLWPLLLILAIVYLPRNKLFSVWTILAAVLCAFFSAELFVWGIAIYLTYTIIFCLTHHKHQKFYALPKHIFLVLMTFLSGHLIYSFIIFWVYGSLPRYDIYLEFITAHIFNHELPHHNQSILNWNQTIRPHFMLWGGFTAVYFMTLVYFFRFYSNQKLVLLKVILPVSILGILECYYYIGRSFDVALIIIVYPLMIVSIILVDKFVLNSIQRNALSQLSFSIVFGVVFVFTTAFSAWKIESLANHPYFRVIPNIASVYSCVIFGNTCQSIYHDLTTITTKAVYGPPIPEELSEPDIEAYKMLLKWQSSEQKVLFFYPELKVDFILMHAGKFHKLPLSSMRNDTFSPTLVEKIINDARKRIKKGDILIQSKAELELSKPIYEGVLYAIREKWTLCLLEQTKHVAVYQVSDTRCNEYHYRLKKSPGMVTGSLFSFAPNLFNQITIERPSINHDIFGLSETSNTKKLESKVHFFQNGSDGTATKNTSLEGIKDGVSSLVISPSSEGNSFVRYTFNQIEQLVGKTLRFSIWVKSDNIISNAVQVDIQSNVLKRPIMLESYQNSQNWEQLIVEKTITAQDKSVYLTLNVKNNASSVAYFDHIEIELHDLDASNIPVISIQDNNPNHVRLEAIIPQEGYLIRKEHFHSGWRAKVNQIETPIEKYEGAFQAIKVNKGKVLVDFEFKP